MINGNPNEFLEVVASGQDITYKFKEDIYWFQGYNKGDKFRMEIFKHIPAEEGFTWECEEETYLDCLNRFINDPIFDGKTFWEVEQEIEWGDW